MTELRRDALRERLSWIIGDLARAIRAAETEAELAEIAATLDRITALVQSEPVRWQE